MWYTKLDMPSCQVWDQEVNLFIHSWNVCVHTAMLIRIYNFKSSAYSLLTQHWSNTLTMSLIYNTKSIGPKQLPWITAVVRYWILDK